VALALIVIVGAAAARDEGAHRPDRGKAHAASLFRYTCRAISCKMPPPRVISDCAEPSPTL
jgi:hypothetical protein